ncbi:phosphatidylinositol glycan-related [Anaeramoeba flamelloides]|uniref:Phosphatidylinositol glycan-related n=1 Tax=Anaeramoeba flamelloides TaxID=1746091 RepID=A0ABQ8XSV4_9EUKA|nr:phosphatidylinositol glycan-related [Anaeramoeba flamelloides]
MNNRNDFCVWIFLLLTQCLGLYVFWGAFFPSQITETLPTSQSTKEVLENQKPTVKYDRLVLLVIDALRADFVFSEDHSKSFPFLSSLIHANQTKTMVCETAIPTVTLPRIKSLISGTIPDYFELIRNFNAKKASSENLIENFLKQGKKIYMYGDDTWEKLFPNRFHDSDPVSSFFVSDTTVVDNNITRHLDRVLPSDEWDVLILHYLGVDHVGHTKGPHSKLMESKLFEMDSIIQRMYKSLFRENSNIENEKKTENEKDKKENEKKTLFVVTGDHGMNDQGNHGGGSKNEIETIFIFLNEELDTKSNGGVYPSVKQIDFVPTIATLFGLPIPSLNLGKMIPSMLSEWESIDDHKKALYLNINQFNRLVKSNDNIQDFFKSNNQNIKNYNETNILNFLKTIQEQLEKTVTKQDIKSMVRMLIFLSLVFFSFIGLLLNLIVHQSFPIFSIKINLFLITAPTILSFVLKKLLYKFKANAFIGKFPLLDKLDNLPIPNLLIISFLPLLLTIIIKSYANLFVPNKNKKLLKINNYKKQNIEKKNKNEEEESGLKNINKNQNQNKNQNKNKNKYQNQNKNQNKNKNQKKNKNQNQNKKQTKINKKNQIEYKNKYKTKQKGKLQSKINIMKEKTKFKIKKQEFLEWVPQFAHIFSLFSSSYVEEEHNTLFTLLNTILIIQLFIKIEKPLISKLNLKNIIVFLLLLFNLRLMRYWNKSGDKYIHEWDIVKWLEKEENYIFLLIFSITSIMIIMIYSIYQFKFRIHSNIKETIKKEHSIDNAKKDHNLVNDKNDKKKSHNNDIKSNKEKFLKIISIFCQFICFSVSLLLLCKLYFAENFQMEILIARLIFLFLLMLMITLLILRFAYKIKIVQKFKCGQVIFILIAFLLQKPSQYGLIILLISSQYLFFHSGFANHPFGKYWIFLLMRCSSFAFGNTNKISTLDFAGAYTGLTDYNQEIVFLFSALIAYTGPIFYTITFLLSINKINDLSGRSFIKKYHCILWSSWLILENVVFCGVLISFRHHLFIWSVFTPKYIYEMANTTFFTLFIFSLFISEQKKKKKID